MIRFVETVGAFYMGGSFMNTFEKDEKYVAHAYKRYPVCFVSGKGSLLYDENEKNTSISGREIGRAHV